MCEHRHVGSELPCDGKLILKCHLNQKQIGIIWRLITSCCNLNKLLFYYHDFNDRPHVLFPVTFCAAFRCEFWSEKEQGVRKKHRCKYIKNVENLQISVQILQFGDIFHDIWQ